MKAILVTGGLGFIGSNFIRLLLEQTDCEKVINLDKQTYAGNPENLEDFESNSRYVFCKGDICDAKLVSSTLSQYQPDALVNFAAESHVDRSIDGPEPFVQTNVVGTLRLLEDFKDYHNSTQVDRRSGLRFLHVSTDEVYGSLNADDPAFCETTSYSPNSPYSASKAGADHLVRAYHHTFELPVVTTNCSNNYGPYQFPEKLIPLMILNACEGKICQFMEMVQMCGIGCMWKITVQLFGRFLIAVEWGRTTVLAVIPRKRILKWWILFVPCLIS